MKNKNIGGRVLIKKVLVEISPEVGWRHLKKIEGTIVEREGHEQYYHTCSGGFTYIRKQLIENDCFVNYAIKLDNGVVDIEGNSIVVVREWNLKFLDTLPPKAKKVITEKQYINAKKVVEEYENISNKS